MDSYNPDAHFDRTGKLVAELAELAPAGDRRMGANPHANGGKLRVDLDIPNYKDYAVEVKAPAAERLRVHARFRPDDA